MSIFIEEMRPVRNMLGTPRLISSALLAGKKGESEKIVAKKVEKVGASSKLTKKQQALKDAKDAVAGAIGALISDKPTKEKIRAYMEERIKCLNED
jgi:hypothetical protein